MNGHFGYFDGDYTTNVLLLVTSIFLTTDLNFVQVKKRHTPLLKVSFFLHLQFVWQCRCRVFIVVIWLQ